MLGKLVAVLCSISFQRYSVDSAMCHLFHIGKANSF